jgi:hypothetical protein
VLIHWPIKHLDELLVASRREVRVAHRHRDRGVPEPLLDAAQRRARHHELRRKRVSQVVPANLPKPRAPARSVQTTEQDPVVQLLAGRIAEHELTAQVLVPLQSTLERRRHRHLALAPALGRTRLVPNGCAPNHNQAIAKVDVAPLERPLLAHPSPRIYGVSDEAQGACLAADVKQSFARSQGTLRAIVDILTQADQLRYRVDDGASAAPRAADAGAADADSSHAASDAMPSAPDAAATPASDPSGLSKKLITDNDYGSGYCHTYELTNTGSAPVTWSVSLALGGMLNQNWESKVTGNTGTVTFSGVDYNATLAPGQSAQFGFCVTR